MKVKSESGADGASTCLELAEIGVIRCLEKDQKEGLAAKIYMDDVGIFKEILRTFSEKFLKKKFFPNFRKKNFFLDYYIISSIFEFF